MEDTEKKNQLSLPANYVSLADLQQRWLNQQKQKTKKEETLISMEPQKSYLKETKKQHQKPITEKKEPQKSNVEKNVNPKSQFQEPRNPNFQHQYQCRRNFAHRKGPKESKIEGTLTIGVEIDGRNHPVDDLRVKDEKTMDKKKVPCMEIALGEEMHGRDCSVEDLRVKDEKIMEKKSKKMVPKSEPSEIEAPVEEKVKSNGQDQIGGEKIKKWKKKKKNNKMVQISVSEKRNPVTNVELGNDRTAEIGQRFEKLSVNRRWTAGVEGSRRVNKSYGRVNRVIERKWGDNGLIWVKKGIVEDHTMV